MKPRLWYGADETTKRSSGPKSTWPGRVWVRVRGRGRGRGRVGVRARVRPGFANIVRESSRMQRACKGM